MAGVDTSVTSTPCRILFGDTLLFGLVLRMIALLRVQPIFEIVDDFFFVLAAQQFVDSGVTVRGGDHPMTAMVCLPAS